MKVCPSCHKEFADENAFCLDDGTPLRVSFRSEPTVVIPVRSPIGGYGAPPTPASKPPYLLFGLILVLAMAAAGFGVAYFMSAKDDGSAAVKTNQNRKPAPDETPENRNSAPAPKPQLTPFAPPPPPPGTDQTAYPLVTVNSPRDRFLALKNPPCVSPCGQTLAKIPHGTRLRLGTCQEKTAVADGRRGRWCYVSYAGLTGWVFDGFVTY